MILLMQVESPLRSCDFACDISLQHVG